MSWQPIETAPIGEPVLLYDAGRQTVGRLHVFDGVKLWRMGLFAALAPTHWQPLPEPPET